LGTAKDIIVKPISSRDANRVIKSLHYSGKVCNNSQLHFGVFLGGKCGGVLQFGCPLDRSKVLGLVEGTKWNNMMELNRMALAEWLPKNGESRSIAVCLRLIKKCYPHVDWILSYADGTQCGHGTIYQATGFVLTMIKTSKNLARLPSGNVIHKIALEVAPTRPRKELGGRSYFEITGGRYDFAKYIDEVGAELLDGHQLRYIFFINKAARNNLTVPEIEYSKIDELGIRMVRGNTIAL
jgi:hypothetical protein